MSLRPEISRTLAAQHTRELEHAAVAARLPHAARRAAARRRHAQATARHPWLRAALARFTHRPMRPAAA
jgi:hypothetical protein